jgi:signal transduction histidine kinase
MARGDSRRDSAAPPARQTADDAKSGVREKPARNAIECMRHDARSSAHALSGFLDLLQLEALGGLSDEQRRAVGHMEAAVQRMSELLESALELAEAKRPLRPFEISRSCLVQAAQHVVYAVSRSVPSTRFTFAAEDGCGELHVQMEHERVQKLLNIMLDVARSTSPAQIDLRASRTDLHASLVVAARSEQSGVRRSSPNQNAAAGDLDAMASAWSNREYVRLKRLESLLGRHKGRLLVAPDLTRLRVMLPLAR